jgi:hypothetical protein
VTWEDVHEIIKTYIEQRGGQTSGAPIIRYRAGTQHGFGEVVLVPYFDKERRAHFPALRTARDYVRRRDPEMSAADHQLWLDLLKVLTDNNIRFKVAAGEDAAMIDAAPWRRGGEQR